MFTGYCDLRVTADAGARPEFVTLVPFGFMSAEFGCEFIVPAGTTTDGPSIPVLLSPLIGGTPGLRAAVLHDYLCRSETVPRATADRVFREALIASGVDAAVVESMYAAVRAYSGHVSATPAVPDHYVG